MNDIIEGLGSAAQGGLFSRALEPKSGAKEPHPDQPENCKNCGTALTGAYCHACGQKGHIHRTIGAFMHDLLHGALHFEGKLWRTLPMLVFRPGKLTRRYIEGERARFVSPMALFLFTVFLMFAVFQVLGISTPTNIGSQMDTFEEGYDEGRGDDEVARDDATPRDELVAERDAIAGRLEAMEENDPARAETETELAVAEGAIRTADSVLVSDGAATFNTGIAWLDEKLVAKWNENPSLMLYKLVANAYKFSWLLIPISIPFVWLTFAWRRRFKAYDHAIFVTYSLSFMTMLFILIALISMAGLPEATLLLLLIPPVHLYKQLRHAYGLSRFSTFWRLMVISLFIWIVIILFLQLLFLLGAF